MGKSGHGRYFLRGRRIRSTQEGNAINEKRKWSSQIKKIYGYQLC